MISNKFISKDKINIKVVLHSDSNKELFENIFNYIKEYLNIKVVFIEEKDILNNTDQLITNEVIDFYFIDFLKEYEYIFSWNFYSKIHKLNSDFKLVLFKKDIESNDVKYFKNGADDIIYTNKKYYPQYEDYIKWKIFSLLRRKWNVYHSKLVLIRNGFVIDLLKRKVIKNNVDMSITKKEFEVLSILVEEFHNENKFCSKNILFKKIYGVDNNMNSRVIDQIIFRLKKKFGSNFFEINNKGIKIS